jgi:hypothetical protein
MPFGNPQKPEGAKEEAKVQPVTSSIQSTTTEEPLMSFQIETILCLLIG